MEAKEPTNVSRRVLGFIRPNWLVQAKLANSTHTCTDVCQSLVHQLPTEKVESEMATKMPVSIARHRTLGLLLCLLVRLCHNAAGKSKLRIQNGARAAPLHHCKGYGQTTQSSKEVQDATSELTNGVFISVLLDAVNAHDRVVLLHRDVSALHLKVLVELLPTHLHITRNPEWGR